MTVLAIASSRLSALCSTCTSSLSSDDTPAGLGMSATLRYYHQRWNLSWPVGGTTGCVAVIGRCLVPRRWHRNADMQTQQRAACSKAVVAPRDPSLTGDSDIDRVLTVSSSCRAGQRLRSVSGRVNGTSWTRRRRYCNVPHSTPRGSNERRSTGSAKALQPLSRTLPARAGTNIRMAAAMKGSTPTSSQHQQAGVIHDSDMQRK